MKKCDFSGWATKFGVLCSDGRTIMKDAFKDGKTKVPLVWQHNYNSVKNILGHAMLENRDEGVYAYCFLNDSDEANAARTRLAHGDIDSLSIFANGLTHDSRKNVLHGVIREVSLVIGGANKEALIDYTCLGHSDEYEANEAYIFMGEQIVHSDKEFLGGNEMSNEEINDLINSLGDLTDEERDAVLNDMTEEELDAIDAYLEDSFDDDEYEYENQNDDSDDYEYDEESYENESEMEMAHAGMDSDETIGSVIETMNDKQKAVLLYLLKQIKNKTNVQHSGMEEDDMSRNVFDGVNEKENDYLSHDDMKTIINEAPSYGSLKKAFTAITGEPADSLKHDGTQAYGITPIDYLFPDYQNYTKEPQFIKRKTEWVDALMSGVHHSPFSRIKTIFADITEDAARAKGYMKGHKKIEEVFTLLKRTTDPQTVYKKQRIDRDDAIDITDFDVVAYIKKEMRMMLDEELARACLIGDGRLSTAEDKISPDHIRPIWGDDELFTITSDIVLASNADDDTIAKTVIRAIIKANDAYEGSGSKIAFMPQALLTKMLLLEDGFGRSLYKTKQELATKLLVDKVVPVPVMANQYTEDGKQLMAIIVDPSDYNIGADKGGAVSLFDGFDIDYNQQKYLIETRCSGALVKAKSAIVVQANFQ